MLSERISHILKKFHIVLGLETALLAQKLLMIRPLKLLEQKLAIVRFVMGTNLRLSVVTQ